jgi:hypothetical protein
MKTAAHRVVGVVVKTLIFPVAVDVWRNIARLAAAAAELGNVLVGDLKS